MDTGQDGDHSQWIRGRIEITASGYRGGWRSQPVDTGQDRDHSQWIRGRMEIAASGYGAGWRTQPVDTGQDGDRSQWIWVRMEIAASGYGAGSLHFVKDPAFLSRCELSAGGVLRVANSRQKAC